MLNKKITNQRDLAAAVILMAAILLVANYISSLLFFRLDLTAKKLNSITPATKEIVKEVKDVISVKLYFSNNVPAQFMNRRQQIVDILADYRSYNSNFNFQVINPTDEEAATAQIQKLQFNDQRREKLEVINGYMGLTMTYHDKKVVLPVIENIETLEYKLTSGIKKLIAEDNINIGVLQGKGTPKLGDALTALQAELNKNYTVQGVEFTKEGKLPDKLKVLIIIGARENFTEAEFKELDRQLAAGTHIMVFHDGINLVTQPVLFAFENKSNLKDYLGRYGMKINTDFIADPNCAVASYNQGPVVFGLKYPLWPKLGTNNFNQQESSLASLDNIMMAWASSITLDKSKNSDKVKLSELAGSSAMSWTTTDTKKLALTEKFIATSSVGSKTLMAKAELQNDKQSKLYLISDADMMQDQYLKGAAGNMVLMQNIIDGLALDGRLSQIKSREIEVKSIRETSDQAKLQIKYGNIFGATILVVLYGLYRFNTRRKSTLIEI